MASSCSSSRNLLSRLAVVASAVAFLALPFGAHAQTAATTATATASSPQYSSSSGWMNALSKYDFAGGPAAPNASPQYGQYGQYRRHSRYPAYGNTFSHIAFEAGAGMTAPIGNDTHGYNTYGYNVTLGGGWNFNPRFGTLLEFQFNRNKIPGSTLTQLAIANNTGTPLGGNINTWSLTLEPIIYQPFTQTMGAYLIGGGGFYRKVTNFTEPALATQCGYYFCYQGYVPQTVAHSSSNQGGLNIGFGLYWKAFGPDSNAKLYAEARYVWVDSPVASNADPYGSGTEGLIPVTLGVRF